MFVLLSGEGATDIGRPAPNTFANGYVFVANHFNHGPMTVIVDKLFKHWLNDSFLENGLNYGYVGEHQIVEREKLKGKERIRVLPKKKREGTETGWFRGNARTFGIIATELPKELGKVVAIFFRDSDNRDWNTVVQSVYDGFRDANFPFGVPMIPKPKSEAWLICAFKDNPYHGCDKLEDRSGNDDSPNPLKAELSEILDGDTSREYVNELLVDFDPNRLSMPSFQAFRQRFEEVLRMPAPVTDTES